MVLDPFLRAVRDNFCDFLAFIENSGKVFLDEITRGNLGAFIEHEQDSGFKASTVLGGCVRK